MVYRLLEERSKKGAGRSMRALAWRVCAWVLPLYRNLEPITRKPLGGGSGDTSLQQRDESEERGSDLHCQVKGWTAVGLTFHCPTSYDNSEWSRRGEAWETGGGPFLGPYKFLLLLYPLTKHRHHPHIHSWLSSHPQLP